MISALVAGAVAGFGIALPVGAVGVYLVAVTARSSLRTGVCAGLGVATADGVYALIATVGGSVLTPLLEPVAVPLRWTSALLLIGLALRGAVITVGRYRRRHAAGGEVEGGALRPGRAYLTFLGITLMNPLTVVYFTALVLGGGTDGRPGGLEAASFAAAAFVASAGWQVLLAGGGALLGRALIGARSRLTTALASSVLIIVLAAHLLVPMV
ncbi:LysE family transporter [Streptomyces sp. MRC013]|uniref:LysE family transporter n=1 Tax=Streptomyces sp. MRC013 TaxID=2898276 RepID=UPI0020264CCC|nr:LysE family transporter [Streptomyces sp. MRC013]URM90637.1 LysE family transporter [Streptomyces sp. MRC013]